MMCRSTIRIFNIGLLSMSLPNLSYFSTHTSVLSDSSFDDGLDCLGTLTDGATGETCGGG